MWFFIFVYEFGNESIGPLKLVCEVVIVQMETFIGNQEHASSLFQPMFD
jgi:hypothetical protein